MGVFSGVGKVPDRQQVEEEVTRSPLLKASPHPPPPCSSPPPRPQIPPSPPPRHAPVLPTHPPAAPPRRAPARVLPHHPPIRMAASSGSNTSSPAPSPSTAVVHKSKIQFCAACGSPTKLATLDGDQKMRAVCSSCGRVHYENPKMVCAEQIDEKGLLISEA